MVDTASVCRLESAYLGERGGCRELALRADQEFGGGLVRRPAIVPAPCRYPGHPPATRKLALMVCVSARVCWLAFGLGRHVGRVEKSQLYG